MPRISTSTNRGYSLIEVLFALTVIVVAMSTRIHMILSTQVAARHAMERTRADALAKEGILVSRALAQQAFDVLVPGTYGLHFDAGAWHLEGTEDVHGKYTRTLTITAIAEDVRHIESAVSWNIHATQHASTSFYTHITNWGQTAGDAAHLAVHVSDAVYTHSGTVADGMYLTTVHPTKDITITHMEVAWKGAAALTEIHIDSMPVFVAASTSPSVSGAYIDIDDVLLVSGADAVPFGPIVFTEDMQEGELVCALHLSDGSIRYARIAFI